MRNVHMSPPPTQRNAIRLRAAVFTTDAGNGCWLAAFGLALLSAERGPQAVRQNDQQIELLSPRLLPGTTQAASGCSSSSSPSSLSRFGGPGNDSIAAVWSCNSTWV